MSYDFITKYTDIFCWKKWEKLLHCKSFSHFFNKKYWHIWDINVWNFNETLTNDVVSFEQAGPVLFLQNNPKNPGYKTNLALWDCIGRDKSLFYSQINLVYMA